MRTRGSPHDLLGSEFTGQVGAPVEWVIHNASVDGVLYCGLGAVEHLAAAWAAEVDRRIIDRERGHNSYLPRYRDRVRLILACDNLLLSLTYTTQLTPACCRSNWHRLLSYIIEDS